MTIGSEPPGCGEKQVASLAISGEPGSEAGEPLGGGEEDVASLALSGDPGPEALREKALGTMASRSPTGENISEQSSLAAEWTRFIAVPTEQLKGRLLVRLKLLPR
jgi:hypothetical protein